MKISGVYKISSISNPNRIYIGSSIDIKKRFGTHKCDLKRNKHHSTTLQRHYDKYSLDDLLFEIIEICDDIIEREQYHLDINDCYFNTLKVAGSCKGRIFTDESKIKMSESQKRIGNKPPVHYGNSFAKGKNYTHGLNTAFKVGNVSPFKGKHHTEEWKKKKSEAMKGRIPWNKKKV